jgi:hypothetical protein
MDAKTSASAGFDDQAALAAIRRDLNPRVKQAANYAYAELLKRIPVGDARNGHMRDTAGVEISEEGFELYIRKYYAYFLEKGWQVGARRSSEARAARNLAKQIRQFRKATGSDSEKLKKLESELRANAKRINATNAARRRFRPGEHILENATKAALPQVIEILAGKA